jgi:hypothetical protein
VLRMTKTSLGGLNCTALTEACHRRLLSWLHGAHLCVVFDARCRSRADNFTSVMCKSLSVAPDNRHSFSSVYVDECFS